MDIYDEVGRAAQRAITKTLTRLGYSSPLVIFKNQNAPEPNKTYCAIYIISNVEKGRATKALFLDDVVGDPNVGKHYAQQHFDAVLQVTFVGLDSGGMAFDLKQALKSSILTGEDFLKENLSFVSATDVRSNPQLRETRWVDSFNFDLRLAYSVQHTEDLNWVEFITVNGVQIPYTP